MEKLAGTDFFTREIDAALLRGEIDLAVHSAKDLPDQIPGGLIITAITESIEPDDVLVAKKGLKLDALPQGARIGTSSFRRKTQLETYRNDLKIVDRRGNVEERLEKLEKSNLAAIVIAAAGLIRLGREDQITQRIPFEIINLHPLQGARAVETRCGEVGLIKLSGKLDRKKGIEKDD